MLVAFVQLCSCKTLWEAVWRDGIMCGVVLLLEMAAELHIGGKKPTLFATLKSDRAKGHEWSQIEMASDKKRIQYSRSDRRLTSPTTRFLENFCF